MRVRVEPLPLSTSAALLTTDGSLEVTLTVSALAAVSVSARLNTIGPIAPPGAMLTSAPPLMVGVSSTGVTLRAAVLATLVVPSSTSNAKLTAPFHSGVGVKVHVPSPLSTTLPLPLASATPWVASCRWANSVSSSAT